MSVSKNKILYLHLADVQRGMGVPAMMEAGADNKRFKKQKHTNIMKTFLALISRPLKSPFWGDVVLTQYLANFLKHATKSFHGSFEVIDRSRQKNVHSISRHTLIKVAA